MRHNDKTVLTSLVSLVVLAAVCFGFIAALEEKNSELDQTNLVLDQKNVALDKTNRDLADAEAAARGSAQRAASAAVFADNAWRGLLQINSVYTVASQLTGRLNKEQVDPNKNPALMDGILAFYQGLDLMKQRKSADAIPFLEKACELNPDRWEFAMFLSLAYANTKSYEKSIQLADKAIQLNPGNAELRNHKAQMLSVVAFGLKPGARRVEAFREIVRIAEQALELEKDSNKVLGTDIASLKNQIGISSQTVLAEAFIELKELEKAEKILRETIKTDPIPESRRLLVELLRKRGAYREALEFSQPLVSIEEPYHYDLTEHARILRALERFNDALVWYEKYDALRKKDPSKTSTLYLNDWGATLIPLRKYDEALAVFSKADKELLQHPIFLGNIAMALLGAEQNQESIELFRSVLPASDQDGYAHCTLQQALLVSAEYQSALDLQSEFPQDVDRSSKEFVVHVWLTRLAAKVQGLESEPYAKLGTSELVMKPAQPGWDFYYLERWFNGLSDSLKNEAKPILDKMRKAVPDRYSKPPNSTTSDVED